MAFGDPIEGGVNVQGTIFYGLGKVGWTETYVMNVNGSSNPLVSAETSMARIIGLRRPLLPTDVVAESLRLSNVAVRNDSDLLFPPDVNLGNGGVLAQSANPTLGWGARVDNEDFTVTDTRIYCGWPPDLIPYSGTGVVGLPIPPLVKTWATQMYEILRQPYTSLGGTVRYCLKSFVKPGASIVFPQFAVTSFSLDPNGYLKITALSSQTGGGLALGRTLMVHAMRTACLKGVSGRWRIIRIVFVGATTEITVRSRPCCVDTTALDGLTGTAQVYQPAYFPIRWFAVTRQMTKKKGRPFFGTVGRQPNRCG
jgi:hypothetical protein